MNKQFNKWLILILASLCLILPLALEYNDLSLSGDEVVTYSMANNSDGGFVFSEGRVASYLKEYVFSDSLSNTGKNLIREATDVLKNRKNARFFTCSPDPEVRYYTHDEMADWFEKRNYEKFNLSKTWLFSQSDDANSYLYYCLLNIASSLIPSISNTKWIGFLLNAVIVCALLYVIYRLFRCLNRNHHDSIVYTLLICLSYEILTRIIYIRSYLLAMIFVILLTIYHIRFWRRIYSEQSEKDSFHYWHLIPILMLGYISHYTMAFVMVAYGLVTVGLLIKKKQGKPLGKYLLFCVLAGMLAIMIDPVSIAGLLSKSSGTSVTGAGFINESLNYFLKSVFPSLFFLIWFAVLVFLSKGQGIKQVWKDNTSQLLMISLLVYTIVILVLTKGARYLSVMTPVFLAILLLITASSIARLPKHHGIISWLTIGVFVVCCGVLSFSSLTEGNQRDASIRNAIEEYTNQDCVYFRVRRAGYENTPYISEFANTQIVTVTTDGWQQMINEELFHNQSLIVWYETNAENEETDSWLSEHNIILKTPLLSDESMIIYEAEIR